MGDLSQRRWREYRAALIPILPDICNLCGQPVDKGLPGTHPDGPTLDHTHPRSRGGNTYDRTNIALAHRRCNSRKRDTIIEPRTSRNW